MIAAFPVTAKAGIALGRLGNDTLGLKLLAAIFACYLGALNNIGIGSFAPTIATIYARHDSAWPSLDGTCTFSLPVRAWNLFDLDVWRNNAFTSTFGNIGVLAVYCESLNISMLQWVIAGVVHAGLDILAGIIPGHEEFGPGKQSVMRGELLEPADQSEGSQRRYHNRPRAFGNASLTSGWHSFGLVRGSLVFNRPGCHALNFEADEALLVSVSHLSASF
jgi:hypothetical protein